MGLNFSIYDIGYFFKKNQKIFIFFMIFFLIGIIVGVIIASSSDSYYSLLTTSDKVFFDYVNGKANFSKQTIKIITSSLFLELIFFLLSLNFYTSLLSYLIVGYQSSIMFLSISAVIVEYGFRGVMMSLFLSLPVNMIIFITNTVFAGLCLSRVNAAFKFKRNSWGFDNSKYWLSIFALMIFNIVFACLVNFLFSIILRSRIFIIF